MANIHYGGLGLYHAFRADRMTVRTWMIALLGALLTGCNAANGEFSTAPPSLRVAGVALENGQPDIAAFVASSQLRQNPKDSDARLLRANALAAEGQYAEAAADFREVLAAQPRSLTAILGLSRIVMAVDPSLAEALLAPAALHGDATAAIWNNLGVARDLLQRHAEAQDAYRKALAADPGMHGAQVNLARSLSLQPPSPALPAPSTPPAPGSVRTMAGPACLEPALETGNGPDPGVLTSVLYRVVQWIDGPGQALRRAEARLQCDPVNLQSRRAVAYAAMIAGDNARALEIAMAMIRTAPLSPIGFVTLADIDRIEGNNRGALTALLKARTLAKAAGAALERPVIQ